ncbi:ROK family protein [Dehalogenimonas sp. THU2]|uniref:ROK family protein n=1 Tax=Dehalogenimonas sp. THU2 TaxID=3151121 RepID=UPI00321863A8
MNKSGTVLVADLGGTKVLAGTVGPDGCLRHRVKRESEGAGSLDAILGRLCGALDEVLGAAAEPPVAVALAVAGAIDLKRGVVTNSPNLTATNHTSLRDMLAERYHLPAVMINDASSAALAEHRLGAGRGTRHMIFLTVSTGVGGGIIIDGKLYQGADGSAGEFGHTTIDMNGPPDTCGSFGCLEQNASGTAIAREATRLLSEGRRSSLGRILLENDVLTAEDVAGAASDGDDLAREVFNEAMRRLGIGVANIVNIFNPEMIVIGGGVSQTGDMLFEPVRRFVAEHAFKLPAGRVKIVPAALGVEAGAIGAALYAREELNL